MPTRKTWRDARGRLNSGYIPKRHQKNDFDECAADIEESLYHYCKKNGINYGVINKYEMVRKVFGPVVYREYARAITHSKNINFQNKY